MADDTICGHNDYLDDLDASRNPIVVLGPIGSSGRVSQSSHLAEISRAYEVVNAEIKRILFSGRRDDGSIPNSVVHIEDYLTPTIQSEQAPLDDERGEFQYFLRLRGILESAASSGTLPIGTDESYPFGSLPHYLKKLTIKENPS